MANVENTPFSQQENQESNEVDPPILYSPRQILIEKASSHPRNIEGCKWFRTVTFAFDIPEQFTEEQKEFRDLLSMSMKEQGHTVQDVPSRDVDMVIGFHKVLDGEEDIYQRVEEIPIMASAAQKKYDIPDLVSKGKYVTCVDLQEDITTLPKREMENIGRMHMVRLGALKTIFNCPDNMALFTMEGGCGREDKGEKTDAYAGLRDRLVTHACAKESGSYVPIEDAVSREEWGKAKIPDYLATTFRQLGEWGQIDKPFDVRTVARTDLRARQIQSAMNYTRQSESAGAGIAPMLVAEYYADDTTMLKLYATKTGRDLEGGKGGIDKTKMDRNGVTTVAISPKAQEELTGDETELELFNRYSLGVEGEKVASPSIEFDEMAVVIMKSPLVRVAPHEYEGRKGWKFDEEGEYLITTIRGFVHTHTSPDAVLDKELWGVNAAELFEYIEPNLDEFPHAVGCGRDIQFANSTDRGKSTSTIMDPEVKSNVQVLAFDALNHGTNYLIRTAELPGTDFIPDNPYEVFLRMVDPDAGVLKITDEVPMI